MLPDNGPAQLVAAMPVKARSLELAQNSFRPFETASVQAAAVEKVYNCSVVFITAPRSLECRYCPEKRVCKNLG